jgi:hypothetical protein
MGRVVADRAITLEDVVTVLREAGPVEQFEGRDVGVGKGKAVDEDMGFIAAVGGVERLECRGVGVVDFERFAWKGIELVHLAVPDVVAGTLEKRIGRPVSGAGHEDRHSE